MSHDDDFTKGRGQSGNRTGDTPPDRGRRSLSEADSPPASWLEKLHAFCEQHRELLEEPQAFFRDGTTDIEGDCLTFELFVRSPHERFFAQIHDHLARLATKLGPSSRVSFSVAVVTHRGENGIRAVFQMKKPDHDLLLQLDDLFRRHLRKFRYHPPATSPSAAPASLPIQSGAPEPSKVAFQRTVFRKGHAIGDTDSQETSVITFPVEGNTARKPEYKALEHQNEEPEVPPPADTKDQVPDPDLTEPESTGKKHTAFRPYLVPQEREPSPAGLIPRDAEIEKRRGEITALQAVLEGSRHAYEQLNAISSHQIEAETLFGHIETVESVLAEKQDELRHLLSSVQDETVDGREEGIAYEFSADEEAGIDPDVLTECPPGLRNAFPGARVKDPLEYLEEHFGECLTYFGAKRDRVFQYHLREWDPKFIKALENKVNYTRRTEGADALPPVHEIVKPGKYESEQVLEERGTTQEEIQAARRRTAREAMRKHRERLKQVG